jgi:hypothetical protein
MYGYGSDIAGVVIVLALLPSIAMLVLSIIMIVKYFKLCGDVRSIAESVYRLTRPQQQGSLHERLSAPNNNYADGGAKKCAQCGAPLKYGATYCDQCGKYV